MLDFIFCNERCKCLLLNTRCSKTSEKHTGQNIFKSKLLMFCNMLSIRDYLIMYLKPENSKFKILRRIQLNKNLPTPDGIRHNSNMCVQNIFFLYLNETFPLNGYVGGVIEGLVLYKIGSFKFDY